MGVDRKRLTTREICAPFPVELYEKVQDNQEWNKTFPYPSESLINC